MHRMIKAPVHWTKNQFENIRRQYSKISLVGLLALGYSLIPDTKSRLEFWKAMWPTLKQLVIAHQRIVLMAIGIAIICWDHRLVKKRAEPEPGKGDKRDPGNEPLTRERILALRDKLRAWRESLGEKPEIIWEPSMASNPGGSQAFMEKNKPHEDYINKMHYGFLRRFSDESAEMWLELGELGSPISFWRMR